MQKRTVTFFNLGALLAAILGLHLDFQNLNAHGYYDSLVQRDVRSAVQRDLVQTDIRSTATAAVSDSFEESDILMVDLPDALDYATSLDDMGISLHPGSDFMPDSDGDPSSVSYCKSLVYRTLKSLPKEPVNKLGNLTLYFSDTGRRGLGGGDTIILRCQNVTDAELVGVLVHEVGHIMDTGVLTGSSKTTISEFRDGTARVYENDPSLEFYRLSFENEATLREDASEYDFVSGYAMSDPFEDFAETYAYYILHGTEFRDLTDNNLILSKKYEYMKTVVFEGREYFNGDEEIDQTERHYDVTVLPYDMERFFKI